MFDHQSSHEEGRTKCLGTSTKIVSELVENTSRRVPFWIHDVCPAHPYCSYEFHMKLCRTPDCGERSDNVTALAAQSRNGTHDQTSLLLKDNTHASVPGGGGGGN
jgi:hypothetical protein